MKFFAISGEEGGFKNVLCLEETAAESGGNSWQKISLRELLDQGWKIKNGWPMGGGNISAGQVVPDTQISPFVSLIVLEKGEQ
ncbi:MAG TPA: hypothetical protein VMC41_01730 [Candidatus Nanoarchaeia archaeon]|nr:hypothetical protein [Candidatus Nanoarchaeia archaeon]